jgi:CheY-like chemotaxis protein
MMPQLSGIELCRQIRNFDQAVPPKKVDQPTALNTLSTSRVFVGAVD